MSTTKDIPRFLKSCARFGLLVMALLLGLFAVNHTLVDSYGYSLNKSTETLICGPSIMRRSLDPALLNNTENIAQDAEFYGMSRIKLEYLLNKPHNVQNIILFLSPAMFANKLDDLMDNPLAHKEITRRLYPIADPEELHYLGVPRVSAWQNMFQQYALINLDYLNILVSEFNNDTAPDDYPYIGSFHRSKRVNVNLTQNRFEDLIIPKSPKESAFNAKHFKELKTILDLAEEQKIRVLFVNTPLYKDLRQYYTPLVDKEFTAVKSKILNKEDVHYLDLSRMNLPDTMYSSITHLNTYGADYCTDTLRAWMIDQGFMSLANEKSDL